MEGFSINCFNCQVATGSLSWLLHGGYLYEQHDNPLPIRRLPDCGFTCTGVFFCLVCGCPWKKNQVESTGLLRLQFLHPFTAYINASTFFWLLRGDRKSLHSCSVVCGHLYICDMTILYWFDDCQTIYSAHIFFPAWYVVENKALFSDIVGGAQFIITSPNFVLVSIYTIFGQLNRQSPYIILSSSLWMDRFKAEAGEAGRCT